MSVPGQRLRREVRGATRPRPLAQGPDRARLRQANGGLGRRPAPASTSSWAARPSPPWRAGYTVSIDDVRRVAVPVLRHRIGCNFAAELPKASTASRSSAAFSRPSPSRKCPSTPARPRPRLSPSRTCPSSKKSPTTKPPRRKDEGRRNQVPGTRKRKTRRRGDRSIWGTKHLGHPLLRLRLRGTIRLEMPLLISPSNGGLRVPGSRFPVPSSHSPCPLRAHGAGCWLVRPHRAPISPVTYPLPGTPRGMHPPPRPLNSCSALP